MFRKFVSSLCAVVMLCGCGSQPASSRPDTAALAAKAVKDLGLEEKTEELEDRIVQGLFFFEEDTLESSSVYIHNDSSADIVAVFDAKDVDSCREKIDTYLQTTKLQMQNYYPDEVFKVENAVVEDNGSLIVLIVCDDLQAAKKEADTLLGK